MIFLNSLLRSTDLASSLNLIIIFLTAERLRGHLKLIFNFTPKTVVPERKPNNSLSDFFKS